MTEIYTGTSSISCSYDKLHNLMQTAIGFWPINNAWRNNVDTLQGILWYVSNPYEDPVRFKQKTPKRKAYSLLGNSLSSNCSEHGMEPVGAHLSFSTCPYPNCQIPISHWAEFPPGGGDLLKAFRQCEETIGTCVCREVLDPAFSGCFEKAYHRNSS